MLDPACRRNTTTIITITTATTTTNTTSTTTSKNNHNQNKNKNDKDNKTSSNIYHQSVEGNIFPNYSSTVQFKPP